MILTADSGSTKTTWVADGMRFTTQGINPFHQTVEEMRGIIAQAKAQAPSVSMVFAPPPGSPVLRGRATPERGSVSGGIPPLGGSEGGEIHFYGAGCTKEKAPILKALLQEAFPNATEIEVASDMLGAARALFGSREGIACILGTGANSCLYDGRNIVSNVSPMGYILGDEGSGAVLGKTFLNLLYKGGHSDFIETFERETALTQPEIIQRVYREPMPNRFLASLCPFIREHIGIQWIADMAVDCFRLFFRRNVAHYHRPDLPCSFVGSIAFYFEPQLREAAEREGFIIGRIIKEPL